jgi:PAS domain S-box-containing protein
MRIDPEVYLYPLINKWPIPSDTAESLLIRKDGESALFLNNLRFQTDTALKLRIPLTDTIVPAVKATQGIVGIAEGKDYSGADVVSYLKPIADSPWYIVAKMSMTEANAPLNERLYATAGFVVSLLVVSSIIFVMSLRQQSLYYLQEKLKADEGNRETKEFLESLFDYANAPIIVWDKDFKILRFNNAFQKLTGRKDTEVVGQHLKLLFPLDKVDESMQLIKRTEIGEKWETVEIGIIDVTGKVFTVLWNSATIFSKDGTTHTATVAQGQDITDRKVAEQKLEENLLELKTLNQAMVDREMKMIELKKEIEELHQKQGL